MHAASSRLLAPCLTASAVVLAGLLVSQIGSRPALPEAGASNLNQQAAYTFLTAAVADDEDALFVIDNLASVLLVYQLSNDNERMVLANGLQLDRMFATPEDGEQASGEAGQERQIRDRRDR